MIKGASIIRHRFVANSCVPSSLYASSSARIISYAAASRRRHNNTHISCTSLSSLLNTSTIPAITDNVASVNTPCLDQVRYHRTDYEGPGKYGERETGTNFGTSQQHDHAHNHDNTHDGQANEIDEEEKQRIRQLLKSRYTRRSGSYSHRGYTVGIGGPGEMCLLYEVSCFI